MDVGSATDLPALPPDRPDSPYEPETPVRLSLQSQRLASTTAIPLRFRRPPSFPMARGTPSPTRDMQTPTSTAEDVRSPLSVNWARHVKTPSSDHKPSPRFSGSEFRPLYLMERSRSTPTFGEEEFPPLPPSRESSRTPSVERQAEDKSPLLAANESEANFQDSFAPDSQEASSREAVALQMPERPVEESLAKSVDATSSQQTTRTATGLAEGLMSRPASEDFEVSQAVAHEERAPEVESPVPRAHPKYSRRASWMGEDFEGTASYPSVAERFNRLDQLTELPDSRPQSPRHIASVDKEPVTTTAESLDLPASVMPSASVGESRLMPSLEDPNDQLLPHLRPTTPLEVAAPKSEQAHTGQDHPRIAGIVSAAALGGVAALAAGRFAESLSHEEEHDVSKGEPEIVLQRESHLESDQPQEREVASEDRQPESVILEEEPSEQREVKGPEPRETVMEHEPEAEAIDESSVHNATKEPEETPVLERKLSKAEQKKAKKAAKRRSVAADAESQEREESSAVETSTDIQQSIIEEQETREVSGTLTDERGTSVLAQETKRPSLADVLLQRKTPKKEKKKGKKGAKSGKSSQSASGTATPAEEDFLEQEDPAKEEPTIDSQDVTERSTQAEGEVPSNEQSAEQPMLPDTGTEPEPEEELASVRRNLSKKEKRRAQKRQKSLGITPDEDTSTNVADTATGLATAGLAAAVAVAGAAALESTEAETRGESSFSLDEAKDKGQKIYTLDNLPEEQTESAATEDNAPEITERLPHVPISAPEDVSRTEENAMQDPGQPTDQMDVERSIPGEELLRSDSVPMAEREECEAQMRRQENDDRDAELEREFAEEDLPHKATSRTNTGNVLRVADLPADTMLPPVSTERTDTFTSQHPMETTRDEEVLPTEPVDDTLRLTRTMSQVSPRTIPVPDFEDEEDGELVDIPSYPPIAERFELLDKLTTLPDSRPSSRTRDRPEKAGVARMARDGAIAAAAGAAALGLAETTKDEPEFEARDADPELEAIEAYRAPDTLVEERLQRTSNGAVPAEVLLPNDDDLALQEYHDASVVIEDHIHDRERDEPREAPWDAEPLAPELVKLPTGQGLELEEYRDASETVRAHLDLARDADIKAEEDPESMIIEEYQPTASEDLASGKDGLVEPETVEQPALEPDEIEEPLSAPPSRQVTEPIAEEEWAETSTKKSKKSGNKKGKKGRPVSSSSRMPVGIVSQAAPNDDSSPPTEDQSLEESATATPVPEPEEAGLEDVSAEAFTIRSGKKAKGRKKSKRASAASTPAAESPSPAIHASRAVDDIPNTQTDELLKDDEAVPDIPDPTEAQPDDEFPIPPKGKGKKAGKKSKRKSLPASPPVVEQARDIETSPPSTFATLDDRPMVDEPEQIRSVDSRSVTQQPEPIPDLAAEDPTPEGFKDVPNVDPSFIPLPSEGDGEFEELAIHHSVQPLPDQIQSAGAHGQEISRGINLEESISSVLTDPAFSRPRSGASALEEPTYDELPLQESRPQSRRASRKSSRRVSFDASAERDPLGITAEPDSRPPPDNHKEFAAVLAAGLAGAGFDPNIVQGDQPYAEPHPSLHELDDDNEGFSELHRRQTRGISGKRSRTASPPQSQAEPPTTQHGESVTPHHDTALHEPDRLSSRELETSEANIISEAVLGTAVAGAAGLAAASLAARTDHREPKPIEKESSEVPRSRSMTEPVSTTPGTADPVTSRSPRRISTETISPAQVIPGRRRVLEMFPDLERVKRKAPARTDTIIEQPTKRVSLGSGEEAVQRIITPKPSASQLVAESPSLTSQVSAQDLAKPAWSWVQPENRDSAVVMDSPQVPQQHEAVRDSGYHDLPVTPGAADDRSPRRKAHASSRASSKSPATVQVEVSPGWDVSVERSSPIREDPERESIASADSLPRAAPELAEHPAPDRLPPSPPAVESTSKDRSSAALFESSPSTRELPSIALEPTEPVQSESSPPSIFGPQGGSRDGLAPYTPGSISHSRSASMPLDTIHEDGPESPLAKKSRPLSDIGDPERTIKSARLSDTPETLAEKRHQSSLHIEPPEADQRALSPSSVVSMGELIDNRDWPEVDDEKETVSGIDQVLHEDEARRTPSSGHPSLGRDSRKVSPISGMRSPSVVSDKSIGRIKSPEHVRSASAASMRSDRSLRRMDMSGDLRAASRLSGAGVRISATPQPQTPPVAGASSNERLKGIGRRISMEGVYVSFVFRLV